MLPEKELAIRGAAYDCTRGPDCAAGLSRGKREYSACLRGLHPADYPRPYR